MILLVHACMLSCFSHVRLSVTLWTLALQASLSMGFSGQEYWSGLPCPPPGDLLDPGIEPVSLESPALAGGFFEHWHHLGSPIPVQRSTFPKMLKSCFSRLPLLFSKKHSTRDREWRQIWIDEKWGLERKQNPNNLMSHLWPFPNLLYSMLRL